MLALDDTIVAISTPIGEGGIGIVRLSGPQARVILQQVFLPSRVVPSTAPNSVEFESHRFYYGHVLDRKANVVVDEVLAVLMHAPRTYTRQDVAEIHCHGGIVPLRRTLELLLRRGARLAQPGEFTLRAFLNGRIDLAQAEAVLDVVRAKTELSLRVAMAQLAGCISGQVQQIRGRLVEALAYLEASLDFPEDEIPTLDITVVLADAQGKIKALLAQADWGLVYRQGVRTAIVGRPNVGKSSLLNALLRTSRAIVTPIPGTTRDTLEETLNLRGIPICLVDTAGITESDDLIEKLGIERSRQALQQADLVLLIIDGSEPLQAEDWAIADAVRNREVIVVVNKLDLPAVAEADALLPQARRVRLSALTGENLSLLEDAVVEVIFSGEVQTSDVPAISNPRHAEVLRRALHHVTAAQNSHQGLGIADLIAVDLTSAVAALGEVTGETVGEDVLEAIFHNFCVGK
ncbi:MAG: tRNA uridine-5-carboxymethylaminomethyl(34) synthesis GTPase MnmE [Chloroflexi bacterium]|nr:tRNA uridine-5-carboxymethylaminomethyl(34) synthesis GTPase MnmE [Chloroflexota bacterium]